jgi:multidrug efflux pump subunit AcrA (membrane-fusion protein)
VTDLVNREVQRALAGRRAAVEPRVAWSLAVVVFFAACSEAPPPPSVESPSTMRWVAVREAERASVLEVPARVVPGPTSTALVGAPLRATVTRVRVRAGDQVDAGVPLVDVVMPEVLDAAGRLEGARVRLEAWTERHAQLVALRADGLAKSLDVSEAAARVAEARADVHTARSVLLAAGLRDETGAAVLTGAGVTPLRAPFSGVVVSVSTSLGESRDPTSGPLVTLVGAGATRIEARFSRPLSVAPEGSYAFVGVDGTTPVRLVSRSPAADSRDGTFLAWFEADGPLVAASLGRVVVRGGATDTFLVPASAIERFEGRSRVVTRHGAVEVEVLRCELKDCVVRAGLAPGDEVQLPERAP